MSFEKWICTHCGAINPNRSYECHNCRNNGNYERIVIQGQRNMNTLDRLIELADEATKGNFIPYDQQYSTWMAECNPITKAVSPIADFDSHEDAAFYCAANPDTVKRLCELLKEAKKLLDDGPCNCNGYGDRPCESCNWLAMLEQLEKGNTNESSS